MSVLQELLVKFYEKKTPELYVRIIKELQTAEKLWIAFSPASNNYYLGNEQGKAAAYIFSEKDYYDLFYVHESKKGYELKSVENSAQYRMAFYADLYRSGFESVVIDNGQTYLRINLFDIIKEPEPQTEDKDTRLIVNPSLMRTACWFMQEDAKNPASQEMWELLFTEIFKGEFIVPADTSRLKADVVKSGEIKVSKDSEVAFPMLQNADGKKFYPFFTDFNELRKYDMKSQYSALAATFKDLEKFAGKADGIVINPFGVNVVLTADMLDDIKRISAEAKKKQSEIRIGEPKEYPVNMIKAMSEYFSENSDIQSAYLKLMFRDGKTSYLVAVDYTGSANLTEVYDRISECAVPHSEGIPVDFIPVKNDFAQKVLKDSEPFFKR